MKDKERLIGVIVFGIGVLSVLALALWIRGYSQQGHGIPPLESSAAPRTATRAPTPTHAPPAATVTPTTSPTPTELPPPPPVVLTALAFDVTATARAFEPTLTAMAALGTIVPSPTPGPTPTMTEKEQALVDEQQRAYSQSASSAEECREILKTEPWCSVPWYAKRITRPEWEALFPYAEFILVKYDLYGDRFVQQRDRLFIELYGRRYRREDFQTFLGMNFVRITDQNRELVARAFVLMSLPDYLEEEIVFSDWEEGSWPAGLGLHYNYAITAWTRIQGLEMQWYFLFDEEGLLGATGYVIEDNIGDYIDVPFHRLRPPSYSELEYWRKQPWE